MTRNPWQAILLSLLLPSWGLSAAGCGDNRKSAPVSGTVTVMGKPLADIGVNFEPVGTGAGRGSFGRTDAAGNYTLRFTDNDQAGALIGSHEVTFRDLQTSSTDDADGGALPKQTRELLGLVASLVLRCDDCVKYHLVEARSAGTSRRELVEAMSIGLVVGGTIVIPHLRRAVEFLDDLEGGQAA